MKQKNIPYFLITLLSVSIQAQMSDTTTTVKPADSVAMVPLTKSVTMVVDTPMVLHLDPPTPYVHPVNSTEYWYNMWSSPRFKKATFQRDSLFVITEALKKDTALLRKDSIVKADSIKNLLAKNNEAKNKYNALNKEHDSLKETSANTKSQLTGTIDQQNKQLKEREQKINDMTTALDERETKINNMSTALGEREAKIIDLENQLKRQDSLANALNNALKEALNSFKSDDLKLEMKNGKVYVSLFDKLLFKSGRADVEQAGKDALKKLAEVLNTNSNIDIMVEGHTDSIPIKTEKYPDNWELSSARSLNIVRLLTQSYGVDAKKVIVAAHAEFSPLTSNATPAGRAKNRRTEIILTPNLGTIFNMINNK